MLNTEEPVIDAKRDYEDKEEENDAEAKGVVNIHCPGCKRERSGGSSKTGHNHSRHTGNQTSDVLHISSIAEKANRRNN